MEYKYVIIGAGNGGQSLAGDMVLHGTKVAAIYDKNPAPIRDIKESGGIKMSGPVMQGFAPIEHPTEGLEDAMQQGNVFLVTIVANFHPQLAREMAPYIRETDTVILIPGNAGSSLIFRKTLAECGVKKMPLIGETISMPYATRLLGKAHAGIKAKKLALPCAALPASRNEEFLAALKPAIPEATLWTDSLSIGMSNGNPCGHVPYYLMNIGKVEAPTPADVNFHAWNTPTTDRISDLYDEERMTVMRAIGLNPLSHVRDKIRVYANISSGFKTLDDEIYRARDMVDQGFTAIKIYPFLYGLDEDGIVERVAKVREALGYDVDLLVDVWRTENPRLALNVAKRIEQYRIYWYEEPIAPDNYDVAAEIRSKTSLPIVAGECICGKRGFNDVIRKNAAEILNANVGVAGGILELKEIAAMAEANYVKGCPHNCSSPTVSTNATIHAVATIPNFYILETFPSYREMGAKLSSNMLPIENGYIRVPDTPGLGIEMNEDFLASIPYHESPNTHKKMPSL